MIIVNERMQQSHRILGVAFAVAALVAGLHVVEELLE